MNDNIESIDLTAALHQVSRQRADYALRYRQVHDQRLSLAVYLLLTDGLKKEYGINALPEFVFGPHGKPTIKDHPEIHFNLSHCRHAALCAISESPIGCDVESVPSELDMDVCRYCFNEKEIADILASDSPVVAFTVLWTKKEAYLKLTGEGLTNDLPALLTIPQAQKVAFQTQIAPNQSYVYSVCQLKSPKHIHTSIQHCI